MLPRSGADDEIGCPFQHDRPRRGRDRVHARVPWHATTGTFSLWFDGSDVGLAETGEDIDAVAIDASGLLYLSGADPVAVTGVTAQDEDVFVFSPTALDPPTTAGSFTTVPYFDGSAFGLGANDVSGFDVPGI